MADSLGIFGEGTFEEHILELAQYLARTESEENRPQFLKPFQDAVATAEGQTPLADDETRRRRVIKYLVAEIHGLGDGNEREIEGFFGLVYCHVLSLYPPDSPDSTELITFLIRVITSSPRTEQTFIRYRLLSNLFNALPNRSTLRLQVYNALLSLATANEELDVLQLKTSDVERWIDEWDISVDERSEFIQFISEAYAKIKQAEQSYSYQVLYVRSLPPNSPKAEAAALALVARALKIPSVLNFDAILKLDAVRHVRDHPLFALLKIILQGNLSDYQQWLSAHEAVLAEFELESKQLEGKLRLLMLGDLGSKNIGRDVPYAEIASALQISEDEVEVWVIDVIRTRLLSGRLSQPHRTLHVTRSISRSFDKEEWETVEKRLVMWKNSLQGILAVMASAKNTAQSVSSSLTQSQSQSARPLVQV